ncbi:MAG: SDR family oxidoreductase [Cyclobacteriaceae bacterium]|nr:SDR family oxidoreductase [Cyclobacteriaceae bacterium]
MKVLITGANGYIGRRLVMLLQSRGHELFCLVRDKRRLQLPDTSGIQILEGDLLKPDTFPELPDNIDVAFYLVHSMGASYKHFQSLEEQATQTFLHALQNTRVKQIIYLGGIANDNSLSRHLSSRCRVEEILSGAEIPLTVLRAAIIIGSGGASFEITRDLVEKLPVMVAPRWIDTLCQPIAIRNVLQYLEKCMLNEASYHQTYDIGGPEVLSYKEMLLRFAKVRGLKRWIIRVPVLSPGLSSLWLYFVTSTSFTLARSLVSSMHNEVVVEKMGIDKVAPIELITYDDAIKLAFDRIAQNEVVSSWKDALTSSNEKLNISDYMEVPVHGCFTDKRNLTTDYPDYAFKRIWSIGGANGWYYMNSLWKLRGILDKLVGGVGLRRGRRSQLDLTVGDALDFWRVIVADPAKKRLLLYAEMKLPGEAWLEFKITEENNGFVVHQNATFRPKGLWGRLYWYAVLPFHHFIFNGMLKKIALP